MVGGGAPKRRGPLRRSPPYRPGDLESKPRTQTLSTSPDKAYSPTCLEATSYASGCTSEGVWAHSTLRKEQGGLAPMSKDEEVELLSRVDLFDSLSKEEIRQLLDENSDVRLEEGETFYAPWEHDGELFVLKKGRMRLYKTEGAREFTLEVVEV